MNRKHRKAAKVAAIVGGIGLIPLLVLAYFYSTNIEVDADGLGVVPDFAYTFTNHSVGITHYDTERYPLVVAVLKDVCQPEMEAKAPVVSCEQAMSQLREIQDWVESHIKVQLVNVKNPHPLRLVAMSQGVVDAVPEGWNRVALQSGQRDLVPESRQQADYPAIVLIDDSSFFRAYVPFDDPRFFAKVTRELTRIVSHQYLMHYVTQQTLMWEKARGRRPANAEESH
jgi:hypothetical protein